MTREELQNVIDDSEKSTEEKITLVLNQVNSERSTAVNEERLKTENVQKQLDESKGALKKLQKENGDNEALQKTIAELTQAQEQLQNEYNGLKIDSAVKLALTKTGARNVDIAFLALDKDLIKLDKDGEVIGLNEQIEKLKTNDETSFLFEEPKVVESVQPEEPKRQTYEPAKGDKPMQKSQGAELGDRILAERQRRQKALKINEGEE